MPIPQGPKSRFLKISLYCLFLVFLILVAELAISLIKPNQATFKRNGKLGWTYIPGISIDQVRKDAVEGKEIERESHVRINQLGFNGSEVQQKKKSNSLRIIVIGDSYVAATQVNRQDNFVTLLANELSEDLHGMTVETINGGVSGWAVDNYILSYTELWRSFEPDIVLCVYFAGNDLADTDYDMYRYLHSRSADVRKFDKPYFTPGPSTQPQIHNFPASGNPLAEFLEQNSQIYRRLLAFSWKFELFHKKADHFVPDLGLGTFNNAIIEGKGLDDVRELSIYLLSYFNSIVERDGARFGVVLVPNDNLFVDSPNPDKKYRCDEENVEVLYQGLVSHNVAVLNLLPLLREASRRGGRVTFLNDGHFNPNGHKVVANAFVQFAISLIPKVMDSASAKK